MTSITTPLSKQLKNELKNANEIWVAVGLINKSGLEFILDSAPKTCKMNFVVGIDLPTDPSALYTLLKLRVKRKISVANVLLEDFFHPKVYVIKSGKKLSAFVGSSNCTNGGLNKNIEMSLNTKNIGACTQLLKWFNEILVKKSEPLTIEFIDDYQPKYDKRIKRRKQEKKDLTDVKSKAKVKLQANLRYKSRLIKALKKFKNSKDYQIHKSFRSKVIRDLRDALDYPNFKKLDLRKFFSIKDLGTIVPIRVKGSILKNPEKFRKLMKHLISDSIPLPIRIDDAINSSLAVPNIGEGFISKILVCHDSKKYFVYNDAFVKWLQPFGLSLPRGISFGEKYEITRDVLKEIMHETEINNFATLDQGLWLIHND